AGVPGTPGAMLWLESARSLVAGNRTELLLLLAAAWLAALTAVMRQWRQAFGVSTNVTTGLPSREVADLLPPSRVPFEARMALWISAVGLVTLGHMHLWRPH